MRALTILLLLLSLSACARPVGDFDRIKADNIYDEILPKIETKKDANAEIALSLNLTDEEKEMHNRVWRYLISPHAEKWFFNIASEWQRTRLIAMDSKKFAIDEYYNYLRTQKFSSSKTRYNAIAREIEADIKMSPAVFRAICAVKEIDRRRNIAVYSIASASEAEIAAVKKRQIENEIFINWFIRALRYRYDSYSFALDRLLIETPHEEARIVDARLSEMIIVVNSAENENFCNENLLPTYSGGDATISSRLKTNPFSNQIIYKK